MPPALGAMCYRAYRVPYEDVPQLETPEELAVEPPDLSEFRVAPKGMQAV